MLIYFDRLPKAGGTNLRCDGGAMQLTLIVTRNGAEVLRQWFQNRAEADRATAEALRHYPDAEVVLREDGTVILSAGRGRSAKPS